MYSIHQLVPPSFLCIQNKIKDRVRTSVWSLTALLPYTPRVEGRGGLDVGESRGYL